MHEKIPPVVASAPALAAKTSVKEDRIEAEKSQTAAAAFAEVSVGAWRTYELDRDAVTARVRVKCDKAAVWLKKIANARRAGGVEAA